MAHTHTTTLSRSESRFLVKLSAMVGRSDPRPAAALRFIWQLINSRPAAADPEPTLWLVPSATKDAVSYTVDIDSRLCSCEGFHYRRICPHIAVAFFAARLLFEMNHARNASMISSRPELPSSRGAASRNSPTHVANPSTGFPAAT